MRKDLNTTKSCYKVESKDYTVYYSYAIPICVEFPQRKQAFTTNRKFSVTTSRHMNTLIKPDLRGEELITLSNDKYKTLLHEHTNLIDLGRL